MTVVAVKKEKSKIHLVCDTMVSYGQRDNQKTSQSDNIKDFSKIGSINDITYGFSGNVEDMLVLKQFIKLNNPGGSRLDDIEEYILKFYKYSKDRNPSRNPSIMLLLVFDGKVFCVWNYMIYEVDKYEAIGSGMFYARTAMYLGETARKSVEVTIEFAGGVGGNIEEIILDHLHK